MLLPLLLLLSTKDDGPAATVSMLSAAATEGRRDVDVLVAVSVGDGGLKVLLLLPPLELASTSSIARPSDSSNGCIAVGAGLAAGDSGGVGGFSIALNSIIPSLPTMKPSVLLCP